MIYRIMICLLLLSPVAVADWEPTDFNTWKQDNQYVTDIGGLPRNYQKADNSWEIIDTTWESVGDTLFVCEKAVITAKAWPDGVSELSIVRGVDTIRLKRTLDRFIFYDTLTQDTMSLMTDIPLSGFVHEGRKLRWNFPGGRYRLMNGFGRKAAQVVLEKPLLDNVCNRYDNLPLDSITTMVDSLYWDEEGDTLVIVQVPVITTLPERVALGTVFRYEISGVSDSLLAKLTSHRGARKRLLKFGRRALSITSHKLHFQGEENVQDISVLQEWRKHPSKSKTFYLCEYLMMWQLDSLHTVWPNRSVWHGATESVQDFSLEDTHITQPSNSLYNYGGNTGVRIGRALAGGTDTIALIRPTVAGSDDIGDILGPGATVNSCSLFIFLTNVGDPGFIDCHQLLKYFIEGNEGGTGSRPLPDSGATWNFFQAIAFRIGLAGFPWAHADGGTGPTCAQDGGVENLQPDGNCADSNADHKATATDQVFVSATQYYGWDITAALGQHWYDNGDARGVMLWSTANVVSVTFASSEVVGDINGPPPSPYFRFRYEVAEVEGQVILID